ncbi:MAG: glycosyltransferase [bacterium]
MPKTCIIIPCYNEEKRFDEKEFSDFFQVDDDTHFYLVNDGSTDETLDLLNKVKNKIGDRVRILHLKKNKGKAEAVRIGMLSALSWMNFDYFGYFDADFSAPLNQISLLVNIMEEKHGGCHAIFGSRILYLNNVIKRKAWRHYGGRIFAVIADRMLDLSIYDTQCGAKIFSRDIINNIFLEPFRSRWLFDIEIILRLRNIYGKQELKNLIIEFPLHVWKEKGDSKISMFDIVKIPYELLKIYYYYGKEAS